MLGSGFFEGVIDMKTKVNFFLLVVSAVLAVCVRGLCSTPIVHWRFDEDQGTTAYDSVGDNDGTLVNGPSWTVGHFLSALEFDGVNDYVRVPDNSSLDINGEITISAWIRLNSIPRTYPGCAGDFLVSYNKTKILT